MSDNFRLIGMSDLEFTVYVLALNARHEHLKMILKENVFPGCEESTFAEIETIKGMLKKVKM